MMMFFPFILIPLFIFSLFAGARLFRQRLRDDQERAQAGSDRKHLPESGEITRHQGLESRIFRIADSRNGRITVSDVVLETGLGVKEAEEYLNKITDSHRVRMDVDEQNGMIYYEFPEIRERRDRL